MQINSAQNDFVEDKINLQSFNFIWVIELLSRFLHLPALPDAGLSQNLSPGKTTTYVTYHHPNGRQFEIEHIWGDKFKQHKDEFEQENNFQNWRNSIGALLLLPNGTNQSFTSDKYADKLEHYLKENTFAQTLHPKFYNKNPNFI